jgi:hypothetical protein
VEAEFLDVHQLPQVRPRVETNVLPVIPLLPICIQIHAFRTSESVVRSTVFDHQEVIVPLAMGIAFGRAESRSQGVLHFVDLTADGLHAVLRLPASLEQSVIQAATWQGLALHGLAGYRHEEAVAEPLDALVVGYATPPDSAWAGALEALRRVLP